MLRTARSRICGAIAIVAVGTALLALAPAAGAWSVAGAFAPSPTPSLGGTGGDPQSAELAYDAATHTLALRLAFAAPPSRSAIDVAAGSTRTDGTCSDDVIAVAIDARDRIVATTQTITERTWVPERTEIGWTWSSRWPPSGRDWTYIGYDTRTLRHKWLRVVDGYWREQHHEETTTGPDPTSHERTAALSIAEADGMLADTAIMAEGAVTVAWSWSSPILDLVTADCLSVRVAGRRHVFAVVTPLVAAPPALVAVAARRSTRASASGPVLHLRLRGRAQAVQIRIGGRRSPALPFARSVRLRVTGTPRAIAIRFSNGRRWTPWRTVTVPDPASVA